MLYADADGDGFGAEAVDGCLEPDGVAIDGDCDDANAKVFPDAEETCDGVDEDCSGVVDDGATDALVYFADAATGGGEAPIPDRLPGRLQHGAAPA